MTKYKCARCGEIVEDPSSNYYVERCSNCGNPCIPRSRCGRCGMFNESYGIDQETQNKLMETWTCSCGCRNNFYYTKYQEKIEKTKKQYKYTKKRETDPEAIVEAILIIGVISLPVIVIVLGMDPMEIFGRFFGRRRGIVPINH